VVRGIAPLLSDDELGAHWSLLHVSQEYEFHRPVGIGDVLDCTPWIAGITTRRGNEFLTLQIDCLDDETSEPVVTSRGTLVFLGSGDQ
jgi:acyl-CoA thioesterase FadM